MAIPSQYTRGFGLFCIATSFGLSGPLINFSRFTCSKNPKYWYLLIAGRIGFSVECMVPRIKLSFPLFCLSFSFARRLVISAFPEKDLWWLVIVFLPNMLANFKLFYNDALGTVPFSRCYFSLLVFIWHGNEVSFSGYSCIQHLCFWRFSILSNSH